MKYLAVILVFVALAGLGCGTGQSTTTTSQATTTATLKGLPGSANTWTKLRPSGTRPTVRADQSMVYDSATDRVIMFGGSTSSGFANDTWAYDPAANTWTELNPSGDAAARARAATSMVYDPATGRVIMFGGMTAPARFSTTPGPTTPTANTWTELSPSGTLPAARGGQSMVYDPASGRVIMFGGSDRRPTASASLFNDTWAYDPTANTWTELSPVGDRRPHAAAHVDGLRPGHRPGDHVRRRGRQTDFSTTPGPTTRPPTPGPSSSPSGTPPGRARPHVDGLRSGYRPGDHVRRRERDGDPSTTPGPTTRPPTPGPSSARRGRCRS